jgi:hypothetical protein
MNACRFLMSDRRRPEGDDRPLSFVVCCSDDAFLAGNLPASPCLRPGSPHDVIVIKEATSAAAG